MNKNVLWLAFNVAAVSMTGVSLLSPEPVMPRIVTVMLFGLNCAYTPFFCKAALRSNAELTRVADARDSSEPESASG